MIFAEPPRTQYDWSFQLLGIPVRVHPFFWLLSLLLGARNSTAQQLVIWVLAVFVSILVHEFGHALTIRYFGWNPRVVLYSFGGLAIYDPSFGPMRTRGASRGTTQILISIAGPGAGFLFAALIVGLLYLTNRAVPFYLFGRPLPLGQGTLPPLPLAYFAVDLLYVNIFWGLLNLLPIYPLDGGQVSRELFLANSGDGVRQSLMLSFVTASVIAFFSVIFWGELYMAIMFGYMAYMNYMQLNGPFGGFGGGGFGNRRPW